MKNRSNFCLTKNLPKPKPISSQLWSNLTDERDIKTRLLYMCTQIRIDKQQNVRIERNRTE